MICVVFFIDLFVLDLWYSGMLYVMGNDERKIGGDAYNHNDLMASW